MRPYILITGYRQQLAKAIEKLGIPYSVVAEKPLKKEPGGADEVIILPFTEIKKEQDALRLSLKNTPTHVIAGTEAGVFPAAVLRRIYQARRSSKSLLIRCTDKTAMKKHLNQYHVPMAGFVTHKKELTAEVLVRKLGLPVVVKDRKNSGGRNVVMAHSVDELRALLAPQRLYEQYLDAAEGSIESFVENGKVVFSSLTEYHIKKMANLVPATYASNEIVDIKSLNEAVIKAMKIKWGLTHLEYYRTDNGLLFGEVALRPPGGYIMELIKRAYDIDPWQVFVQVELGLPIEKLPIQALKVCGTVLLHPGAGKVVDIFHPDTLDLPTLCKALIKVKKGEHITDRQGVGEDVGYCVFCADNHSEVKQDINRLCASNPIKIQP